MSFLNSFTPALRAGRSRPVSQAGPLLGLSGAFRVAKFGATAMLPSWEMYSPRPVLLSRNASTPQRVVFGVMSASMYFRHARSKACDHCSSFSFFSCPPMSATSTVERTAKKRTGNGTHENGKGTHGRPRRGRKINSVLSILLRRAAEAKPNVNAMAEQDGVTADSGTFCSYWKKVVPLVPSRASRACC